MIAKKDFRKINDWLWEIPQTFRPDMRVPARIYASEKLLEDCFRDKSLEQLINTATLPGIIKYAIAMPDAHEGYGFCIGGVAATKFPEGVISPGGVGYDQNCLSGDTKILHYFGYHISIREVAKGDFKVKCVEINKKKIENASIFNFFKRNSSWILKVVTKAGWEIKATPEHPFYTPEGMKALEKLKPGDKIAIYPFEGVPYEDPSSEIILTEEDIKKVLLKLGRKPGTVGFEQNLRALKKRDLLPLTYNHSKLPYILKIMGFIFGDGSMNFV